MGSICQKHFKDNNAAVTENVEVSDSFDNIDVAGSDTYEIFSACVNRLENYINRFDSEWYGAIYRKADLSKADTLFTYYATGEISSSQVVRGNENWLFYMSSTDGDPIGDFEGTNRYTLTEMNDILNNALWTQKELENRGINFAIIVAPDKENIYSEFVPTTYTHAEISSTDILIDFLKENRVNIISPKAELLENHSDVQLYYSYDTHWNQLGAYIGVRNVLDSWNISMPLLSERRILSKDLSDNYHYCGEDDLAKMIGLRTAVFNDETEYEVAGTGLMDWEEFEEEQNNNVVSHYSNPDAEVQSSVLLVGDSFRSSMVPSLREMFSDVYVVHRSWYAVSILDDINPDYLISEYVERYSSEIMDIDFLVR